MIRQPISVCMPTYNGELFLRAQLDSILLQLEPGDELIIVDDASRDQTPAILRDLAAVDSRVRLVENSKNAGVVASFETALILVQNEIIFLSDQDDIWLSGKIQRALQLLDVDGVVAVLSNSEIYVDDRRTGRLFFPAGRLPRFSVFSQLYRNDFIGCCMCFRKGILKTALPFPKRVSMHDWWLGVVALTAGTAVFDETPTILYRRHRTNASPASRRRIGKVVQSRFHDAMCLFQLFFRRFRRETIN
jgi:glycosyltransferase involved in cell wall biosynthesis